MTAAFIMADSNLPDEIVEAIAISNAKAIGEQPAILANLALANQILNNNLQQQAMISQQQAMNQITLATVAKCVSLITSGGDTSDPKLAQDIMEAMQKMFKINTLEQKSNGNGDTDSAQPASTKKKSSK